MYMPRFTFASIIILLFGMSAACAQETCPSSIRIISPSPNQVVSSQETVRIDAATTPALDLIFSPHVQVSASISAQGFGFHFPITAGDLRSNASPSVIERK